MTTPLFGSKSSATTSATGSGFCNGYGLGSSGFVGPPWWRGDGRAGYCTDTPWWSDGCGAGECAQDGLRAYVGGNAPPYSDLTIIPAELGAPNNPISGVNVTETEPGQLTSFVGNSLPFNLIGPNEMVVVSDLWEYVCTTGCNSGNIKRLTTYTVRNSDGTPAKNIPLGELMANAAYTCTNRTPVLRINSCTEAKDSVIDAGHISDGMWATEFNGEFMDRWTLGMYPFTPAGCGLTTVYDDWQLCGLAAVYQCGLAYTEPNYGLSFATLSGVTDTNQVSLIIGGTTYTIGPNTCGPDTSYLLCPSAIPPGTVVSESLARAKLMAQERLNSHGNMRIEERLR